MNVTDTSRVVQLVEKSRDQSIPLNEQHAAFTRLVEQSQHLVFGLALASLRDVDDAKDVAQEAFATAWLRLSQLRDPSAFSAWLKAIVATQCNRRRRRHPPSESLLMEFQRSGETESPSFDYQSLIATALISLVAKWNEYLWPLVVTNEDRMRTLTVGLTYLFDNEGATQWGVVMAGTIFVLAPLIAVFIWAQRFIIEGITSGATKG